MLFDEMLSFKTFWRICLFCLFVVVFLYVFVLKYGSDSNVTKQTLYTETLFNPLQWWDSMFGKDELLQCNTIDNIVLKSN